MVTGMVCIVFFNSHFPIKSTVILVHKVVEAAMDVKLDKQLRMLHFSSYIFPACM